MPAELRKTVVASAAMLLSLAIGVPSAVSTGRQPAAGRTLTGTIDLVNKQWVCKGPVDLDSVTVTMGGSAPAPLQGSGNNDAVHLSAGCTGRIGRLTIVQYRGDGVKVGEGAHDLVIESGSIRCYARDPGKHQDGVQAMGGQRVTFRGLDVQCLTANTAAFFINRGTRSNEAPTDVVCERCFLLGGGITVRIYNSVRSGVRDSEIVAGHLAALRVSKDSAVDPVNVGNIIRPTGYQGRPSPPDASSQPGPSAPATPPAVSRADGPLTQAARLRFFGVIGIVSASVTVDRPVSLRVSVVAGAEPLTSTVLLPLLRGSRVGSAVSGHLRKTIVAQASPGSAVAIALRLPVSAVSKAVRYRIRVTAVDAAGASSTLLIPVRR